jgi:hypothetical protein
VTTNADAWSDEIAPIRTSLESLPANEQIAFALACAERLVNVDADERQRELSDALTEAWNVFESGAGDCVSRRALLMSRPDIDDDPVAAVYYALESVDGHFESVWRVANRSIDASFDLVPHREDATRFRALAEDIEAESLKQELTWQRESVNLLKADGATPATIQSLRRSS